jgi:hypothetical protein
MQRGLIGSQLPDLGRGLQHFVGVQRLGGQLQGNRPGCQKYQAAQRQPDLQG